MDDGLALVYLLAQPDIELRAVTTCFGNAGLPAVLRATRRPLALAGVPDLPLLQGAARQGLAPTAAARFLVQATASEPGRLTILATGPLSNLAAAAELDPAFPDRCAGIICLGGDLVPHGLAPSRLGWRRLRELNFAADAKAARRVLAFRGCPVTVVPASACTALRLRWDDLPLLPPAVRGAVRNWLLFCGLGRGLCDMVAWDLLPALLLTYANLGTFEPAQVLLGEGGLIAADWLEPHEAPHRLLRRLRNPDEARALMLKGLSAGMSPGRAPATPRPPASGVGRA
ncbi:nucleoside hydrolase, partial [Falsiroseomonas sp. HC035]|uniref:nucleoside hydrolase n=1 Tax=Falsiroseomonas sp. HC035 TaxID=3390999 RepID=UPI003D314617